MTCEALRDQLFAYQFGLVTAEERAEADQHLLGCRGCLAEFLSLKRELETAESEAPASPQARNRLRRAVAEELGLAAEPGFGERLRAWWERPLALGFAAIALAVALGVVHAVAVSPGRLPRALAEEGWAESR